MLTQNELLNLKSRMLLAAETASRVMNMQGAPLQLDEETYQIVAAAMLSLKDDVRRVLAEIDILRGMTIGDFGTLFTPQSMEGMQEHGRSRDVAATGNEEAVSGGNGERSDATEPSGAVRSGGADGETGSGPRPKRNRRRRRSDPSGVDTGSGATPVDSGTEVRG